MYWRSETRGFKIHFLTCGPVSMTPLVVTEVRGVRSRLCLWSRVIRGPLVAGHRHVHCTSKGSGRDETKLRLHAIRQTPRPDCHLSCQTRAVPQAPCSSLAAVLPVHKQKRSSGCKHWSCLFVVHITTVFWQLSFLSTNAFF